MEKQEDSVVLRTAFFSFCIYAKSDEKETTDMDTQSIPIRIKNDLYKAIEEAGKEYIAEQEQNAFWGDKSQNYTRSRTLDFETMMKLLISMKGGCIDKELHEAGLKVSASAFVQRRKQLHWQDFERVFERFAPEKGELKTYKGYRVLAVDGSALNIARNPKSESYMVNTSAPRGYNQLHINPLYDVMNKLYVSCVVQPQPKMDEIGALAFMLSWYGFDEKTLIVADRGYESYNTFAHFMKRGSNAKFLIRVKQNKSAMREIAKLPMTELDTNVSFTITTTQTKADKENNHIFVQTRKSADRTYSAKTRNARWEYRSPYPMTIRVVRFELSTGEYETLATNLPESFTLQEIKELYHARWGIETAFRELKYSIRLINLHGRSDEFAKQEIFASMIMSNFCSRIVNQCVLKAKETNVHEYRVNMKMAIYLCREFLQKENADAGQLMEDIARYTEAVRPDRADERNIKAKSFVGFTYRVSA